MVGLSHMLGLKCFDSFYLCSRTIVKLKIGPMLWARAAIVIYTSMLTGYIAVRPHALVPQHSRKRQL